MSKIYYYWLAFLLSVIPAPLFAAEVGLNTIKMSNSSQDWVTDDMFTQGVEGPVVGSDGTLYAVNFAKEGTIGQVNQQGHASLFVTLPEGSIGNGIRFDVKGNMYIADYKGHNILKVASGSRVVEIFAHNDAMNQPNDLAIMDNGILFASDPNWAKGDGLLWRIDTDGTTHLLAKNMGTTNGVEVSPDNKHLYVNESVQRKVWVFDLDPKGNVSNKRLLIEFVDHGLDGMRTDAEGNLYIARYGAGVIAVVSPKGKLITELLLTGKYPTNVAFGGKQGRTLYVTMQKRGAIEKLMLDKVGRAPLLWQNRL